MLSAGSVRVRAVDAQLAAVSDDTLAKRLEDVQEALAILRREISGRREEAPDGA
jgi:hypothetical protein